MCNTREPQIHRRWAHLRVYPLHRAAAPIYMCTTREPQIHRHWAHLRVYPLHHAAAPIVDKSYVCTHTEERCTREPQIHRPSVYVHTYDSSTCARVNLRFIFLSYTCIRMTHLHVHTRTSRASSIRVCVHMFYLRVPYMCTHNVYIYICTYIYIFLIYMCNMTRLRALAPCHAAAPIYMYTREPQKHCSSVYVHTYYIKIYLYTYHWSTCATRIVSELCKAWRRVVLHM